MYILRGILFLAAILFFPLFTNLSSAQEFWGNGELPIVEEKVDCISIAITSDGCQIAFFWHVVQNEFTLLDYKWVYSENDIGLLDNNEWCFYFLDYCDNCYRIVSTPCWIESWEDESPLIQMQAKPWFAQGLCPGLKPPPKVEQ